MCSGHPLLTQQKRKLPQLFVTRYLLNNLLQQMYPASPTCDNQSSADEPVSLTTDEEDALSYAGGYVVRAMIKKMKKSDRISPHKSDFLNALDKFHEHPDDANPNDAAGENDKEPDWLSLCNHGGPLRVHTEFRNFLLSVEIIVKK